MNKKELEILIKAIKPIIRKNARYKNRKLIVSPSVDKEYAIRIIEGIEQNVYEMAKSVSKSKRNTLMVKYKDDGKGDLEPIYDDVTQCFGHVDSKIVPGTHIYCTKCLKKIEKEEK